MEDAYSAAEKQKMLIKYGYYSDDAVVIEKQGQNRQPAIESLQSLAEDTTGNTNVYKVVDLFGEGNMLVEIGSWTEMSSAGAEVNKGHYMSYFQKRDGKYVCVRDMNVTSSPAK
jgi:ketosteroid isomerase-like protein